MYLIKKNHKNDRNDVYFIFDSRCYFRNKTKVQSIKFILSRIILHANELCGKCEVITRNSRQLEQNILDE